MRLLLAALFLCCCQFSGYAEETADSSTEVTVADDEVTTVNTDQKDNKGGCGCGTKPKG